jgi:lipopolysaccharide/colanic/teichoic acid biosynthesis glycosyltransferase
MSVSASASPQTGLATIQGQPADGAESEGRASAAGISISYSYVKRGLDVLIALGAIIVALPLLLLICVMIVLDSGWPVFYRQDRVGSRSRRRGGRVDWEERSFQVVKFRTMVPDADSSPIHEQFVEAFVKGELEPAGRQRTEFKLRDDPRVTRAGRFLRATSFDELPQLFNVLGGTMSLVGPRPVPPYEVALYEPRHRERLEATPGITGSWQVEGRGRVSFDQMMQMDIEYVRRQSLRLDLSVLVRTVPAVFSKRGAK